MIAIDKASIERAVEKARRVRTKVRMLSFRRYQVTTPEGHVYVVTFDVRGGQRLASCTCKARVACYHIAGAAQANALIAAMRAEVEKGRETEPKPTKDQRRAEEEAAILVKRPPAGERLNGFDI